MATAAEIAKRDRLFQPAQHSMSSLLETEQFFLNGHGRKDGNVGLGYQPFNINTSAHKNKVSECTLAAKKSLEELQAIDFTIAVSAATAALSFTFLPLWTLSVVSTFFFARNMMARQAAVEKQQLALKNLMTCWDWAQNHSENHPDAIMNDQLIVNIRKVMFPLIDLEYFNAITDDEIEEEQATQAQIDARQQRIGNHQLDTYEIGVLHKVYGYEQGGGWLTFISAIGHSFPGVATTAYHWVIDTYNSFTSVQEQPTEQSSPQV